MRKQVAILGAGNIGTTIAEGIVAAQLEADITLTRLTRGISLGESTKFRLENDNREAARKNEILIIGVQPMQADQVLREIKDSIKPDHLLISVVSGLKISRIEQILGDIAVARAMPNIASRVRQSMTCLAFNEKGREKRSVVEGVFESIGKTSFLAEEKFPEATVLCGSGTAIVLKFIRAYMQAYIQHGFNEREALRMASQLVKGAAMMMEESDRHPEVEIDRVTTPGGCTIAALAELEHAGFTSALLQAVGAGVERARGLYAEKK